MGLQAARYATHIPILTLLALTLLNNNAFAVSISQLLHPLTIHNASLAFNTTPPSSPLTAPFSVCTSLNPPPGTILPLFADCRRAIHNLPYYAPPGIFHRGGEIDAYFLPVFRLWKTCNVTIDIWRRGVKDERGSWLEIKEKAEEVNEVCREGERSGGKAIAGVFGAIGVKLGRVSARGLGDEDVWEGREGWEVGWAKA